MSYTSEAQTMVNRWGKHQNEKEWAEMCGFATEVLRSIELVDIWLMQQAGRQW